MTREDRLLLFKDLSARLPYECMLRVEGDWFVDEIEPYDCKLTPYSFMDLVVNHDCDVKPYLRSMETMTEEEKYIYRHMLGATLNSEGVSIMFVYEEDFSMVMDWLNEHHFDYRGLIDRGLALEAPEGMYNKEVSEKEREVPIPKTVDEAVKTLAKTVSKEDRDYLLENGAISMHNSMGRWIRNEWGLWTGSELKNELEKKGFEHPDDMSNHIIEEFIKYWNNKL